MTYRGMGKVGSLSRTRSRLECSSGSLNLRIHRVSDDKPLENTGDNNASSGTASSSQNDRTSYQVFGAFAEV
ncbi:hypothetical protein Bca4012_016311 [Brassica carinata]